MKRTKALVRKCFLTFVSALFAISFLMPTVLTISNSFMTQAEIKANYGSVFAAAEAGKTYISESVNLKFIPDKVSLSQYITTFISDEVYIMNQGGIKVETDSENPNALIVPTAKYIKGSGDMMWWYLKDMNGSDGNLRLEAQSDGTLKLSDFSVYNLAYDPETWAPSETFLAFYQNAVATKATTGIQGVVSTAKKNGAIYDLQGRRVEKALKGIYIVDGKKIVK